MMDQTNTPLASHFLLYGAAFVVVIAGAKMAAPILIPFLLSIFIAMISSPMVRALQQFKIPTSIAILLLISLLVIVGILLATFIGKTVTAFSSDIPTYEAKLQQLIDQILLMFTKVGLEISDEIFRNLIDPAIVMKTVAGLFNGLGGAVTNIFLILFTVVFILLEVSEFPKKLKRALGDHDNQNAVDRFAKFSQAIQKYLLIKTLVSLGTGLTVGVALVLLGVDYPALWALIAFLLNYIPNIGSIIAAIPAVLIALVQLGAGTAAITAGLYVAVNMIFGSIIEPRLLGRSLGLSTLVVFLSLVFWGWLFGPVGMLLSIPLTVMVKIALETRPQSRWIATLLDQ